LAAAQAALPRLTRADVNRAIRKYLNFADVAVAVVTRDAEAFKSGLVADSPSPVKYANPNMPRAVLDEDAIIQEYPLTVAADNARTAPAAEFFRKAGLPWKQGGTER
jgi:zinc protease